jgi:Tol biopolymer transport system component
MALLSPTIRATATALIAGSTLVTGAAPPAAATAAAPSTAATGTNELVALHDVGGGQATDPSYLNGSAQVASEDGRFVVFATRSPLVPEDTNGVSDVYLRDTVEDRTQLVSADVEGVVGNGASFQPSISALGEAVAFSTAATNLFQDRNGDVRDVVTKIVSTGMVEPVSTRRDGSQVGRDSVRPVISGDSLSVAFESSGRFSSKDQDGLRDVYQKSSQYGVLRHVSQSDAGRDIARAVHVGDVSRWGRWVTFGNDNDVWVRDTGLGTTRRVWHEPDGAVVAGRGTVGRPVVSGDGRYVAFATRSKAVRPNEEGRRSDVFRVNLLNGNVRRVVVASDGGQGNGHSSMPSLSFTGRFVGFASEAGNLVGGSAAGSDAFGRDMRSGVTHLASSGVDGPADGPSGAAAAISDDGRTLVYTSAASNLVADDNNGLPEVFAWRR